MANSTLEILGYDLGYEGTYYFTQNVEVFPTSNSKDKGKLTSEENMREIVTRITEENYVLYDDAFKISKHNSDNTKLIVNAGIANIHGYNVYANKEMIISKIDKDINDCSIFISDEAESLSYKDNGVIKTKTVPNHLLVGIGLVYDNDYNERDRHLLGDETIGNITTYKGVYVGYYIAGDRSNPKGCDYVINIYNDVETPLDEVLILGEVKYNKDTGNIEEVITNPLRDNRHLAKNIEVTINGCPSKRTDSVLINHTDLPDEIVGLGIDLYDRITKPPSYTADLQHYMDHVPSWYVSKYGDNMTGALTMSHFESTDYTSISNKNEYNSIYISPRPMFDIYLGGTNPSDNYNDNNPDDLKSEYSGYKFSDSEGNTVMLGGSIISTLPESSGDSSSPRIYEILSNKRNSIYDFSKTDDENNKVVYSMISSGMKKIGSNQILYERKNNGDSDSYVNPYLLTGMRLGSHGGGTTTIGLDNGYNTMFAIRNIVGDKDDNSESYMFMNNGRLKLNSKFSRESSDTGKSFVSRGGEIYIHAFPRQIPNEQEDEGITLANNVGYQFLHDRMKMILHDEELSKYGYNETGLGSSSTSNDAGLWYILGLQYTNIDEDSYEKNIGPYNNYNTYYPYYHLGYLTSVNYKGQHIIQNTDINHPYIDIEPNVYTQRLVTNRRVQIGVDYQNTKTNSMNLSNKIHTNLKNSIVISSSNDYGNHTDTENERFKDYISDSVYSEEQIESVSTNLFQYVRGLLYTQIQSPYYESNNSSDLNYNTRKFYKSGTPIGGIITKGNLISSNGIHEYSNPLMNDPTEPVYDYVQISNDGIRLNCESYEYNTDTESGNGQYIEFTHQNAEPIRIQYGMSDSRNVSEKGDKYLRITGGDIQVEGDINNPGYNLNCDRVFNAVYNDVAENYKKDNSLKYEPGDIISKKKGTDLYTLASNKDNIVVGVYSDTYGYLLGGGKDKKDTESNYIPIGLIGRVYVKVSGKVEEGDYIGVSDIPGVGISTNSFSGIVGKALESKDTEDVSKVLIQIILR